MNYDPEITDILNRNNIQKEISDILRSNDQLPANTIRNSIFVYGKSGVGKTTFVKKILNDLDYDVLLYDAADIRNKSTIDQIMKASMCTNNVFHMLHNKTKKIAIVMDEIEGMNNGDRGGINALIRLIRPKCAKHADEPSSDGTAATQTSTAKKGTSKQQAAEMFHCNLICICNHNIDKKISEIMKLCKIIHMQPPTQQQMLSIAEKYIAPHAEMIDEPRIADHIHQIVTHSHHDLRKLLLHMNLLKNTLLRHATTQKIKPRTPKQTHPPVALVARNIFSNSFNVNVKNVIYKLIQSDVILNEQQIFTSETNRTMIALIWHENIIDYMKTDDVRKFIHMYQRFLENMCIGDYIDRITFQKQIWQLNEMTSFIKVLYNQSIMKCFFDKKKLENVKLSDIRFTKVLTKYSSEYNNYLFLQSMCEKFNIDRNDLIAFIACATYKHNHMTSLVNELSNYKYKVSVIELKRLQKFINKVDYSTIKSSAAVASGSSGTHGKTEKKASSNTITTNKLSKKYEPDSIDVAQNNASSNEGDDNGAFILSEYEEEEAYQIYQTNELTCSENDALPAIEDLTSCTPLGLGLGGSAPQ